MNIADFAHWRLEDIATGYRDGSLDPECVMEMTLSQLEAVNPRLNAIYDVQAQTALAAAQAAKRRWAAGEPLSSVDGVPVTVKDSMPCMGMRWFHGCAAYGAGIAAKKDSLPVERLKKAGAIIIGKAAMPDFGLSGSGVSSRHGIVRNPWGLGWSPGGSSAGAGASIAAGVGVMSVGTDIAGSVRLPSSHCGLATIKPTQGVIAYAPASTVRSPGPICRYAGDLETWLRILSGPQDDDRYSTLLKENAPENMASLKVGMALDFGFGPSVAPAVSSCIERIGDLLRPHVASLVTEVPPFQFDAYLRIDDSLRLRGWLEYAALDQAAREEVPPWLVEWCAPARDWSTARVREFEAGIERAVEGCQWMFESIDLLITPVMPMVNFPAEDTGIDPRMPLRHSTFVAPFNQSGQPAAVIRAGFDQRGLPIGVQIVGRRFDDLRVVRFAAELERLLAVGEAMPNWPLKPKP